MLNSGLWERGRAVVCVTADTCSALKAGAAYQALEQKAAELTVIVWGQEMCSKHQEAGYTSDTHDKDKSKWEITFNENLWRANKVI